MGKNILLVEDDTETKQEFKKNVPQEHSLFFAENGWVAKNILEKKEPYENFPTMDLIFLDMYMPSFSGEEFLLEIQESWVKPPLIILMVFSELPLEEKRYFYRLGVSSIVRKPRREKDWKKIISYWVDE